jgi:hypothetical protein
VDGPTYRYDRYRDVHVVAAEQPASDMHAPRG